MKTCAIILDYRGSEKSKRCLESLVGQGLSAAYVVDNGNQQENSYKLKSAAEDLSKDRVDYEIHVLNPGMNLGFSRGVNYAISVDMNSRNPHDRYLLINNDAIASRNLLKTLEQALDGKHDTLLVAPCVTSHDNGEECGIWYNRYLGIQSTRKTPLSFYFVSGCCMLVDKSALLNKELLDPAFFMYGEDAYLCWSLHKSGRHYNPVKNANVYHSGSSS